MCLTEKKLKNLSPFIGKLKKKHSITVYTIYLPTKHTFLNQYKLYMSFFNIFRFMFTTFMDKTVPVLKTKCYCEAVICMFLGL